MPGSENLKAKPRGLDRNAALKAATSLFARNGYRGSTDEALLDATGLSPQIFSDMFGDRRALYLGALKRHNVETVTSFVRAMNATYSPLKGIEGALMDFAARLHGDDGASLGVAALSEFGHANPEVNTTFRQAGQMLTNALERVIAKGQSNREIDITVDARSAAGMIGTALVGMRVVAGAGASPEVLQDVARLMSRGLK